MESGSGYRVCVFGRSVASIAANMSSHLICFITQCYKCCTLNTIYKYNAVVNCINVGYKVDPSPPSFTVHIMQSLQLNISALFAILLHLSSTFNRLNQIQCGGQVKTINESNYLKGI